MPSVTGFVQYPNIAKTRNLSKYCWSSDGFLPWQYSLSNMFCQSTLELNPDDCNSYADVVCVSVYNSMFTTSSFSSINQGSELSRCGQRRHPRLVLSAMSLVPLKWDGDDEMDESSKTDSESEPEEDEDEPEEESESNESEEGRRGAPKAKAKSKSGKAEKAKAKKTKAKAAVKKKEKKPKKSRQSKKSDNMMFRYAAWRAVPDSRFKTYLK